MSWVAKTLHVSPTGRAKPCGKTTRKSLSVRQTKYASGKGSDRPLGFDHMCHPQPLTRTPQHPGCATDLSSFNVHQWAELTVEDFTEGWGLTHIPYAGLWEVKWPSGENLGWADASTAMSYKKAAARIGVRLNVYQPEA